MILLLLACAGSCNKSHTTTGATDTPTSTCPTGELLDGDTCVPEACGVGPWGNLPVDGDTVYVTEGGTGDGTEADPLGSIQDGVDLAGERGGALVAVAAGTYMEPIAMGDDHRGVTLAGRCRELVTIDGSEGEDVPTIDVYGKHWTPSVAIEGAALVGGTRFGIRVYRAVLTAADATLIGNIGIGLAMTDATVTLDRVTISETVTDDVDVNGYGIQVDGASTLAVTDSVIERNSDVGVVIAGPATTASLTTTIVRDTTARRRERQGSGLGIQVTEGAHLVMTGCLVQGNTSVGVLAAGPKTEVRMFDSAVTDTRPSADGSGGRGLSIKEQAYLMVDGCVVERNADTAIFAEGDETTIELIAASLLDTAPSPNGDSGSGIWVQLGAHLTATECLVDGNAEVGVLAHGTLTLVSLEDTAVTNTRRGRNLGLSVGVLAQTDARVEATSLDVAGTEGPGVYAVDGGTVDLQRSTLTANGFAGALVLDGSLVLDSVTITDTSPDAEWGGGFGAYALGNFGPPSVTLTNSTIGPQPYAAVWLDGDGAYVIEDNDLSGNAPYDLRGIPVHGNAVFAERGVTAWNGTSGLRLAGNYFHDATDVAVLLDGATAELEDNTWADNGTEVWQQRCQDTTALMFPDPDWVVCPSANVLTDFALQFNTLYLPDVEPL